MLCVNPPPKQELLSLWKTAVYDAIKANKNNKVKDKEYNRMLSTIELIEWENKLPDNEWLIRVLSYIPGPSCEIF